MEQMKFLCFAVIGFAFSIVIGCRSAVAFPVVDHVPVIALPEYEIIPLPWYTEIQTIEQDQSAGGQPVQAPIVASEEVLEPAEENHAVAVEEQEPEILAEALEPAEEREPEPVAGALEPAEVQEPESETGVLEASDEQEPEVAAETPSAPVAVQPVSPSAGMQETPVTPVAAAGKTGMSGTLILFAVIVIVIVIVLAFTTGKKKKVP